MASFSRFDLGTGFSVNRNEVQEAARRQFAFSAVIVAAVLSVAAVGSLQASVSVTHKVTETSAGGYPSHPIQTHVQYVDRSPDHRIAIASNDD
jgi:hypothetical protein